MTKKPQKHCKVCGRRMVWRKKWRRNWDQVLYCSHACRHAGLTAKDRLIEAAMLELLARPGAGPTICPSEVARKVAGPDGSDTWRHLMPATRNAARRLVVQKKVEILQHGRIVDPSSARGPIRIRLR